MKFKNKAVEHTDEEIKRLQDEELGNVVDGVSSHWYGYTYTCDVEAVVINSCSVNV